MADVRPTGRELATISGRFSGLGRQSKRKSAQGQVEFSAMKHRALITSSSLWMSSGLLLATLTALAHHVFYSKVNQRIVQDLNEQEWFSRIGTGLAFSVKTLLTASAGLAYTQLLWYTLRRNSFTLKGLDALFAVVNDVWKFWNWEVWRYSLALVLVAALIWYVYDDYLTTLIIIY